MKKKEKGHREKKRKDEKGSRRKKYKEKEESLRWTESQIGNKVHSWASYLDKLSFSALRLKLGIVATMSSAPRRSKCKSWRGLE